jgi:6-phosphogluconolactonase (cycloisomerase 2 family)
LFRSSSLYLNVLIFLVFLLFFSCGIVPGLENDSGNSVVFSLPNSEPLQLLSFLPPDGATNVPLNSTVQATFSQPIDGLTLTFTSFSVGLLAAADPASGDAGTSFLVGPLTQDATGKTVIFRPDRTFPGNLCPSGEQASSGFCLNTTYLVRITVDLADIFGNRLASEKTWVFSTGETLSLTPPSILAVSPPDGAQVGPDTTIRATFSLPIDPSSATLDSFFVIPAELVELFGLDSEEAQAGRISGKISVTPDGTEAIFEPTVDLSANTRFTVFLTSGVRGRLGGSISDTRWTFATGPDNAPPRVKSTAPRDKSTSAPLNGVIQVTFSEPIASYTLSVQDKDGNSIAGDQTLSGNVLLFTSSVQLEPDTEYTATISGVTDQANNLMIGNKVWTFRTCALACFPRFAYVANQGDNTISIYTMDAATGRPRQNGYALLPAGSNPQATVADPSGRFLYVANHDTDNVSGFEINISDGTLTELAGSPFPGGDGPVSIAVDGFRRFVYVINENSRTISTYSIDSSGILIPGGSVNLPGNSSPRSIAIHPIQPLVFVASSTASLDNILVYRVKEEDGSLETPPQTATAGIGPDSVTAVAPSGKFLYVTNSASNNISAFSTQDDPTQPNFGALTPVPGSPFPTQRLPISIAIDPSGSFALVANADADSISSYAIDPVTGALSLIFGSPFAAGITPLSVAVDPSGQFAYVANRDSSDVSVYSLNDGVLAPGLNVRARLFPGSIAITRAANPITHRPKFAYAANFGSDNISAYTVDSSTGDLTAISGSPFSAGTNPYAVAAVPGGRFLYVANWTSNNISAFSVDPFSGALTGIGLFPIPNTSGTKPVALAIDPSGRFLYVANTDFKTGNGSLHYISAFSIDQSTGNLLSIGSRQQNTGRQPVSLAVDPSGRFLFVANSDGKTIYTYFINPLNGTFFNGTFPNNSPNPICPDPCNFGSFSTTGKPESIAVDPSGQFLYAVYANSGGCVQGDRSACTEIYRIIPETGALTRVATGPTRGFAVSADPLGRNLFYVINNGTAVPFSILTYLFNATGVSFQGIGAVQGLPTQDPITGDVINHDVSVESCFSLDTDGDQNADREVCSPIVVDPSGRFAYAPSPASDRVSLYLLTNGIVEEGNNPIQTFPTGAAPSAVTVVGEIVTGP